MSSTGCTVKCLAETTEGVQALLEIGGIVVDKEDSYGHTPIFKAAADGSTELVKLFVAQGAQINHRSKITGYTPLFMAAKKFKKETAMILCQLGGDLIPKDIFRLSLIRRLHSGPQVLDFLIDCGVNIQKPDKYGLTALHWAAYEGNVKGICALLDVGLDIDARDINGGTPLHLACLKYNRMAVVTLLRHGADRSIKDRYGETALDLALKQRGELCSFIQDAMFIKEAMRTIWPPLGRHQTSRSRP